MYFPGDPIPTELELGSINQKYFVAELGSNPCIEYRGDLPKNLGNKVSSTWRNTKGNHLAKVKAIQTTWGVFPTAVATKNYINSMGKVSTMTLKSREANVRDPRQKTCVGSLQWHGGPSQ